MQTKVVKFGGSSLADAAQFRKAAAIIKAEPERRYVVASAPGKRFSDDSKVTDLLYSCAALAAEGKDITPAFSQIEQRYDAIISELGLRFSLSAEYDAIRAQIVHGAARDYVASRGEYLNARVLAAYLGFAFIDAGDGVFFRDDGSFDARRSYETLGELLSKEEYAVVPGFYGSMPDGTIRTFSRGGSDITGAIVARAAEAALYENWTDVSGMLMADPRIVDDPRVIERLTYRELRELAYMGATVLHDEALFPVREACIPINIRNTNDPAAPGTMIVADAEKHPRSSVIAGIAGRKGFSSITIAKDMMNTEVGFGRKIFAALEDFAIPFEHVPTGIDTMSVVVSSDAIRSCKDKLIGRIFRDTNADSVTIDDGIALVAVVGRGMVHAKGIAGRMLNTIAEQNINIRMITQGPEELNIIIGIDENDFEQAIRGLYHDFTAEQIEPK